MQDFDEVFDENLHALGVLDNSQRALEFCLVDWWVRAVLWPNSDKIFQCDESSGEDCVVSGQHGEEDLRWAVQWILEDHLHIVYLPRLRQDILRWNANKYLLPRCSSNSHYNDNDNPESSPSSLKIAQLAYQLFESREDESITSKIFAVDNNNPTVALSVWPKILERAWKTRYLVPDDVPHRGVDGIYFLVRNAPGLQHGIGSSDGNSNSSKCGGGNNAVAMDFITTEDNVEANALLPLAKRQRLK